MQTDNKGILIEAQVAEILAADDSDETTEYKYDGGAVNTVNVWPLLKAQVQATLDHLAKVTDKELERLLEFLELTPRMNLGIKGARDVLALVLPILFARHQKELQDAVGKAVKEKADWMESAWRKYTKSQIGQARIEERKAIGEALDELAMKTYSGKIPMWLVKCICELEHGESLRGEQPKEA